MIDTAFRPSPRMPASRVAGFTLIEILVAVSLLAVVGVLGYRAVDGSQRTAARLQETSAYWQEIAAAFNRLSDDVRQATAVAGRDAGGRETPAWRLAGPPAQLTLTRAVAGGSLRRLAYRCQTDRLELALWPAYDAPAASRQLALLDGIAGCEMQVLDEQGNWLDNWPTGGQALPRALRIRLTLANGNTIERIFDVAAGE